MVGYLGTSLDHSKLKAFWFQCIMFAFYFKVSFTALRKASNPDQTFKSTTTSFLKAHLLKGAKLQIIDYIVKVLKLFNSCLGILET